jgi:hypothetical protein
LSLRIHIEEVEVVEVGESLRTAAAVLSVVEDKVVVEVEEITVVVEVVVEVAQVEVEEIADSYSQTEECLHR